MGGPYEQIRESAKALGLSLPEDEMASLAERLDMGNRELEAVGGVLAYLAERKRQNKVEMYLKMSRLPLKAPKTFENFDFGRLRGSDCSEIEQLPAMANLYARRNLAFIGPEGVGKTHELLVRWPWTAFPNGRSTTVRMLSRSPRNRLCQASMTCAATAW